MRIIFLALLACLPFGGSDPVTPTTVFIGDSLIALGPWERVCRRAMNLGRGSATSRDLAGMVSAAVAHRPVAVVVMIGVNDPLSGIAADETAENIRAAVSQLHQVARRVVLHRVLPVAPEHRLDAQIAAVNSRLPANALRVSLMPRDYLADGIHLRARGYRAWARHLRQIGVCR